MYLPFNLYLHLVHLSVCVCVFSWQMWLWTVCVAVCLQVIARGWVFALVCPCCTTLSSAEVPWSWGCCWAQVHYTHCNCQSEGCFKKIRWFKYFHIRWVCVFSMFSSFLLWYKNCQFGDQVKPGLSVSLDVSLSVFVTPVLNWWTPQGYLTPSLCTSSLKWPVSCPTDPGPVVSSGPLAQRSIKEWWSQWSLRRGMESLAETICEFLQQSGRVELHTDAAVQHISPSASGWTVSNLLPLK